MTLRGLCALVRVFQVQSHHHQWLMGASALRRCREAHQLVLFGGFVANELVARILKHALKIPRPRAICQRLGTCEEYGMPSAHTQCIVFGLALHGLLAARGFHGKSTGTKVLQLAEVAALAVAAALTAASRVYLGYHDAAQVCAGAAIGAVGATATFGVLHVLKPWYGWACRRWWGRLLNLKDTWSLPDALWVEAQRSGDEKRQ